jgi:hypothetical protein
MSAKRPLHPFHLVTPSPWPMFASFAAFIMTVGGVMYMHSYKFGGLYPFFWYAKPTISFSFMGGVMLFVKLLLKVCTLKLFKED